MSYPGDHPLGRNSPSLNKTAHSRKRLPPVKFGWNNSTLHIRKNLNGQYYRLDSGSDVVMADQLGYARLLGLSDIVPSDCNCTVLRTIYDACFSSFITLQLGAANGVRPDGKSQCHFIPRSLTGINLGWLLQMG